MARRRLLWIGSYTTDSDPVGTASGVQRVWLDTDTGALTDTGVAVHSSGPSFVVVSEDGGAVYTVNELAAGRVTGFAVTDGQGLTERGTALTGGSSPCHLLAHPAGQHLIAANYGDGSISVHPLSADRAPGAPIQRFTHIGSGPNTARQEGPHTHSVYLAPGGEYLLVVDLGTDEVRCHPFDPAAPEPAGAGRVAARLSPGTGPRHLAIHPSGHLYVAGELDSRVHMLSWDAGAAQAEPVDSLPATQVVDRDNYPAEIVLSPDGSRLYLSNRGADTIATFEVAADGSALRYLAETPTGGAWPRHFAQVGEYIVVANQNSSTLTVLPVDPADGIPREARHSVEIPSPACVRPAFAG